MKTAYSRVAAQPADNEHILGPIAIAVARRLGAWLKKRAVLAELARLDARTLDDLRIFPGDFQAIADGTYVRHTAATARSGDEHPRLSRLAG
jgi:uncharacterized protein YjiS (DUF1127 family)